MSTLDHLRQFSEEQYEGELSALRLWDDQMKNSRPINWQLSPQAVLKYLIGGKLKDGTSIQPKYIGSKHLMEIAVATLATDRALLLAGLPGTAKTWVSEHLAAAISGDSKVMIQGTAGIMEDSLRYSWNYASLLKEGPSRKALVASPIMHAMENGSLVRLEELTRIPSDVQDTLLTILSEKILPIPEINEEVRALEGFNLIATSNTRDKGVNELSGALKRRFNVVVLPLPKTLKEEIKIVDTRIKAIKFLDAQQAKVKTPEEEIARLIEMFRELREGVSSDGKIKIKSPSAVLSTAEAISVVQSAISMSAFFGDGQLGPKDLASGIYGAVVKDPAQDKAIFNEYLEVVVKNRADWADIYDACKALNQ